MGLVHCTQERNEAGTRHWQGSARYSVPAIRSYHPRPTWVKGSAQGSVAKGLHEQWSGTGPVQF